MRRHFPPRFTLHGKPARRSLLGLPAAVLLAALLPGSALAASDPAPRAAGNDVIANLWSWNWPSVATECTDVLGPAGYAAVWVAPPAESFAHPDGAWWDVYQPYSYELSGRFGSESDFAAMARTCNEAGVEVYTDVVINHTAAQTGTSYGGTQLTDKYESAVYGRGEYNVDVCDREISNWNDTWEVQNCELLGLPDLKTGGEGVRAKIADYLNAQIALGVSGFRVDAAKHIPAPDLEAIVGALNPTADGSAPFVFHEVFPGATPTPEEYFGSGDVLDFGYADQLKAAFQGDIAQLADFGPGLLPAENSVSFVTNHDTERDGRHLSYRDGDTAVLANVFQLAWNHAAPTVYAGFEYNGRDDAPPSDADGFVTATDCDNGWYCLDRDPRITGMVGWRNAVGDAEVTDWQSPQGNVIGFGRGDGFVAINNGSAAVSSQFSTQLPDGTYCNVLDDCATEVTVSGGLAALDLPAKSAVAFHAGTA
ncbi:alpha-amylase [Streptomyces johnsoniae]|uniref:Alpha-amylase n=1 Tax=Streptomyces johnsoniae TaxID=3075532 RepID=A0ABU2S4X8_9ACTN|nr:alpha-amylase family protein [Streptomyces sp. DSM 41886]MDT0442680.1 alpha-amylase family protein [Streptomyces sp. DSM 41886]